jgi:sodium/bile acid cotransporter 7
MRFLPDRFTLLLITTVIIASLLPAHGQGIEIFGWITNIAVALLFFLHGARLSRDAIVAGITHWRLHLTIFSATFLVFPLLGVILKPVLEPLVTPELYLGILFLCCLPATVQSAIAFTSSVPASPAPTAPASFSCWTPMSCCTIRPRCFALRSTTSSCR